MLDLLARYRAVRERTVSVAMPMDPRHCEIQANADARSVVWHLVHTSWFFERFVLHQRDDAAKIATRDEALAHRAHVDERVARAIGDHQLDPGAALVLEHGLHHEQQHQELMLADAKLALSRLPVPVPYRTDLAHDRLSSIAPLDWGELDGGDVEIGAPEGGFAFTHETPRHRVHLAPYALAARPVANAEVLAFIGDGGYDDARLWSREGASARRRGSWAAPLYWREHDGVWLVYTLGGVREVDPAETACHLSYFEAEAIARWAGARLPTEAEWEHAAAPLRPRDGHWADDDRLHPTAAPPGGLAQLFGDVWEWTASPYGPYPGAQPPSIAVSADEPRGDSLDDCSGNVVPGHMVTRGGSCLTPRGHVRASYRNSLPLSARWHMTGVRLAQTR